MRPARKLPLLLAVLALAAAGCIAKPSPAASGDATAAAHIATQVLNACVSTVGGTPQATPQATLEQPAVQNALLTHSGRKAFEGCLKQHASHHAVRHIVLCVANDALNVGMSLHTKAGKQQFAAALFNCLSVNLQ